MTTLGQVKINGNYDTIDDFAPTISENAPAYSLGHTWLDMTSGLSYELTDADAGTWTRIEAALDYKIARRIAALYSAVASECAITFSRFRTDRVDDIPGSIRRTDFYLYATYVSVYADWTTISGTTISADSADDVAGDLEDFEYEDSVFVYGSKRNDGVKTIESVDAAGLTFAESVDGDGDRFLVLLISIPTEFDEIVGRMVWYDVTIRNSGLGIQSEKIGTYSYTRAESVAGIEYPADVVAGIGRYLNSAPPVDVEEIR